MKWSSNVIRASSAGVEPVRLGGDVGAAAAFAPFAGAPSAPRPTAGEARVLEKAAEYRRGFEEGLRRGRSEGASETEGLRNTFEMVVQELWTQRERVLAEVEPDVTRLALEVARRVVGDVAAREQGVVEKLVSEALRRVAARDRITLRIHPEDLEAVRAERERWLALVEGVEHFEIVEDRRVARGGALVTTQAGSVDARWSTQLDEIERGLLGDGR